MMATARSVLPFVSLLLLALFVSSDARHVLRRGAASAAAAAANAVSPAQASAMAHPPLHNHNDGYGTPMPADDSLLSETEQAKLAARQAQQDKLAAMVPSVPRSVHSTLVWSDEFDTLNFSTWQHEITASGGGNWEFEYYTNNRSNSFVDNGVLHLQPTLTADTVGESALSSAELSLWGGSPADLCTSNMDYGCDRTGGAGGNVLVPIQSARVRSVQSFNFRYGRLEVRAKLPRGDWIWPAIWLLPRSNVYGPWPVSGEVDLMESRGNVWAAGAGGVDSFGSTLHVGPYWNLDEWSAYHQSVSLPEGETFADDFHVFGMVWNKDSLYTYLDTDDAAHRVLTAVFNESIYTQFGWDKMNLNNPYKGAPCCNAPFDQEFYLVMNVAVGGVSGYFPDGQGKKPWSDHDSNAVNGFWNAKDSWWPTWAGNSSMQIDYIRVWQESSVAEKPISVPVPVAPEPVASVSAVAPAPVCACPAAPAPASVATSWQFHAICAGYALAAVLVAMLLQRGRPAVTNSKTELLAGTTTAATSAGAYVPPS